MDTHDREILRRRVGGADLAIDVAYVTSLLRRGELGPERVELASSLGHPVAVAIYPSKKKITDEQFQDLLYDNQTGLDDKSLKLFSVACARRVLPIFEERYPNDHRPRNAIEVAERFALGQASEAELEAAAEAAWTAAWGEVVGAASVAVRAVARAVASVGTAASAAFLAAEAAPNIEQERLFQRRLLGDFLLGLV